MEEKETFGIPSSKIYRNGEVLDLGNIPYFFCIYVYHIHKYHLCLYRYIRLQ